MHRAIHPVALAAVVLAGVLAFSTAALAKTPETITGPAITTAGSFYALPKAAFQPNPADTYKVVFSVTWASKDAAEVNPALNTVARVVNMYTNAGVPLDHLKFVAIAYGPATPIALDNPHYKKEFGVDNPNLPLIRDLRRHRIDVAVCGQAVFQHHYQDDWVDRNVTLALSAMTTITELQDEGYALAPL